MPVQTAPKPKELDLYRVPETINFAQEEDNTLKEWTTNQVFKQCLDQSKDKPR